MRVNGWMKAGGLPLRERAEIGLREKPTNVFKNFDFPEAPKVGNNLRFTSTFWAYQKVLGTEGVRQKEMDTSPTRSLSLAEVTRPIHWGESMTKDDKVQTKSIRWCHIQSCIQSVFKKHLLNKWTSYSFNSQLWVTCLQKSPAEPSLVFCYGTILAYSRENNKAWWVGTCKRWGQEVSHLVVVCSAQTPGLKGCNLLTHIHDRY